MKVSVIIPTYNREAYIKTAIDSVLDQSLDDDFEIIVVDDASSDSTLKILSVFSDPKVKIICNAQNQGASAARNRGVQEAKGEFILFLDSDATAALAWIEELIKPFKLDDKIMITCGKTLAPANGNFWQEISQGQTYIASRDGIVTEAYSGNMAVRRSFITDNYFDESLPFSEDIDFSLKALRHGFKIYYAHKANIIHFARPSFGQTLHGSFRAGAYNTLVRLKWRQIPLINLGTWILLAAFLNKIITPWALGVFLLLTFYVWIRSLNNLTKLIISYPFGLLFALSNCLGNFWGLILFLKWQKRNEVTILMYHRVNDQLKPNQWIVSTMEFRRQMLLLKEHYEVMSMKEVLDFYKKGRGLPFGSKPRVVITLDDGYKDNYVNAFPILKELALPATVFLVTDLIGTDQRMQGYDNQPSPDMLNWQEVKEMHQHGITFCSHTHTHPHLPQLDKQQQRLNIQQGIDRLYECLGDEIIKEVFCYPYGEYNNETLEVLNELNVKLALTVHKGINDGWENRLLLKRINWFKVNGKDLHK